MITREIPRTQRERIIISTWMYVLGKKNPSPFKKCAQIGSHISVVQRLVSKSAKPSQGSKYEAISRKTKNCSKTRIKSISYIRVITPRSGKNLKSIFFAFKIRTILPSNLSRRLGSSLSPAKLFMMSHCVAVLRSG